MLDSLEQQKLSNILDRTPKIEPYYLEVRGALRDLHHGDASDNPLFSVIHGHIGALFKAGKLRSTEWQPKTVSGGVFVPHKDFLRIQDEFATLEGDGNGVTWNADTCLDAMDKYIGRMQEYRRRHNSYFRGAQKYLSETQAKIVGDVVQRHSDLTNENDGFLIVAVPSHFDSPKVWEDFNLTDALLKRIPAWAKINERGVILGSRLHRHDNPRGHDYFSYAARAVRSGETQSMTDKLLLTAQHEGSHGITDTTLIDLLKLGSDNPIYEGIVGALGEDDRQLRKSPSFRELLDNPLPDDVATHRDTTYYSGARYWEALRRRLSTVGDDAWPKIMGTSLATAADLSGQSDFMAMNPNTRVSTFLKQIPARLDIQIDDLEKEYELIALGK